MVTNHVMERGGSDVSTTVIPCILSLTRTHGMLSILYLYQDGNVPKEQPVILAVGPPNLRNPSLPRSVEIFRTEEFPNPFYDLECEAHRVWEAQHSEALASLQCCCCSKPPNLDCFRIEDATTEIDFQPTEPPNETIRTKTPCLLTVERQVEDNRMIRMELVVAQEKEEPPTEDKATEVPTTRSSINKLVSILESTRQVIAGSPEQPWCEPGLEPGTPLLTVTSKRHLDDTSYQTWVVREGPFAVMEYPQWPAYVRTHRQALRKRCCSPSFCCCCCCCEPHENEVKDANDIVCCSLVLFLFLGYAA